MNGMMIYILSSFNCVFASMLQPLTAFNRIISWNSVQNVLDVDVLTLFLMVAGLFIIGVVLLSCLMYKAAFAGGGVQYC